MRVDPLTVLEFGVVELIIELVGVVSVVAVAVALLPGPLSRQLPRTSMEKFKVEAYLEDLGT